MDIGERQDKTNQTNLKLDENFKVISQLFVSCDEKFQETALCWPIIGWWLLVGVYKIHNERTTI